MNPANSFTQDYHDILPVPDNIKDPFKARSENNPYYRTLDRDPDTNVDRGHDDTEIDQIIRQNLFDSEPA